MCSSSRWRVFRFAWVVAFLGLAAAQTSVVRADGCPATCSASRFNIDVNADKFTIVNGDTVHYSVTAFNNLSPFLDGCDAGVSSCNGTSGHGVVVQFCCPSPTGTAYPLFDFAAGHCTELSAAGTGDNYPAAGGGTLIAYPPVACVVTVNPGVTQATGIAAGGDATNPNNPNPAFGTVHFPAGDKGVQGSKPIPVNIPPICGDSQLNETCESCDGSTFPAGAPASHGACRSGGTCGVVGCTFCGDGVVNGGPGAEDCDDGNAINGDGCNNDCKFACGDGAINEACEKCDTNAFPANAPSSHGACRTGTCGNPGCTFCGDGVVNGGEACDDGNNIDTDGCRNNCTLPACGDGIINETCETCDSNVFPGNAPSSHGACRTGACGNPGCTFCGDGVVNGGEACDDGNNIDTDGCRNDCTLPTCGDGLINETCEKCDGTAFPANAPSSHGTCRTGTCGSPGCTFCGDGVVNGGEQCDDGNNIDTDGCRNNCTIPLVCGDGSINETCETCDGAAFPANAPATHGTCRSGGTCGVVGCTFCGDGIVNGPAGAEDCDDGNAVNGDGCNSNCKFACGDGEINQTCETCDTNDFPASAPSSHGACRTGGTCGTEGCTFCGDGIVNGPPGAEECDDGNNVDTDDCQNDCHPPTVVAICRTPGFWGTHAGTEKTRSVNITAAVLDCADGNCSNHTAGDYLNICGEKIDSPDSNPTDGTTDVNDAASSTEAICVPVKGAQILQLARQLTSAGLNCLISGGGPACAGTPLYSAIFTSCNTLCASGTATTAQMTACISELDCLNNGGEFNGGLCSPGGTNNCHDRQLINEDLGLNFEPPGPAGSSNACNAAHDTKCTVVGGNEGPPYNAGHCGTDSLP